MSVLTDDQIERRVERMMDHLDRVFLAGSIDQKTYDAGVKDLNEWADRKGQESIRRAINTGKGRND
jgi:hypothetical protein